jgi:hypothetical protein
LDAGVDKVIANPQLITIAAIMYRQNQHLGIYPKNLAEFLMNAIVVNGM